MRRLRRSASTALSPRPNPYFSLVHFRCAGAVNPKCHFRMLAPRRSKPLLFLFTVWTAQARDLRGSFLPSAIYTAENEGLNCESCLLDLCAGAVFAKSRFFGGLVFNKKLFLAPWSLSMISLFRCLALSGHPGPPGEPPGRLSCLSRSLPTSSLGASWRLLAPSGAFWRLLGASWLLLWRLLVPPGAFW